MTCTFERGPFLALLFAGLTDEDPRAADDTRTALEAVEETEVGLVAALTAVLLDEDRGTAVDVGVGDVVC